MPPAATAAVVVFVPLWQPTLQRRSFEAWSGKILARSYREIMARSKHTDDGEIEVRIGPDVLVLVFLISVNYQLLEPV